MVPVALCDRDDGRVNRTAPLITVTGAKWGPCNLTAKRGSGGRVVSEIKSEKSISVR